MNSYRSSLLKQAKQEFLILGLIVVLSTIIIYSENELVFAQNKDTTIDKRRSLQ